MISFLPLIASLLGLGISFYIYQKKATKTKLICPREDSCDQVVHSVYSKTFGIPNEILGITFYLIQVVFWFIYNFSSLMGSWGYLFITLISILGALFSIYLTAIQAFVLRNWCAWCLGTAFINISIATSLNFFQFEGLFALLSDQKVFWIIVHNIGFILGIGSATITDIFFFRFLQDDKIDAKEKSVMDALTNTIWVGLAILLVSGLMLYLPDQARLDVSSKFLTKVVVVGVITFNGLLLNMFVGPKIRKLSFNKDYIPTRFRRFAFALGAISITSWYSAFLLGSLRQINISFETLLIIYGAILLLAIIGSQIFEKILVKKFHLERMEGNGINGNLK